MIINNGVNSIGGSGKKYAHIVIGTDSFSSTYNKEDVDYLCDGVDDQVEINAAIQELINLGPDCTGEIILLDGVYNLSDKILIDGAGGTNTTGLTITGSGRVTLVKGFNENTSSDKGGMILITNSSNVTICNLLLDGVKTSYPSNYYNSNVGIKLGYGDTQNNGIIINNCTIYNFGDYGISVNSGIDIRISNCTVTNCLYGVFVLSQGTQITNNRFESNANSGIYINTQDARVSGNVCSKHLSTGSTSSGNFYGYGIVLAYNCQCVEVSNNYCKDNYNGIGVFAYYCIVQGNRCKNNKLDNMYFTYGGGCSITGNVIFGKSGEGYGIHIEGTKGNTITGNTIMNTLSAIYLQSTYNNSVVGNICKDFDTTGIYVYGENKLSVITGNVCIKGNGNASDYTSSQRTIYLYMTNYCCVTDNIVAGKAASSQASTNLTSENNLTGISGGPVTGS